MMNANTRSTFYVTTPIYYVTAKPHLGSLHSTLMADVLARWHALRGQKVFFLTGTDEHGQKIAQAAEVAGKQPKEFVDGFIKSYEDTWHAYNIQYTKFIRTTDTYHTQAVQRWIEQLKATGDIYKSFYRGWYCTPDETFVTLKDMHTEKEHTAPACPSCGRQTIWVEEETYNFKLSAYQDRLLEFYKTHADFVLPKERFHEVINFIESGLRDLSISRTTITWGIPFPGDDKHVTYVWADALNNYITAIGYLQEGREAEFGQWWPADVQVLGKDIVRFHAVYWPAFLMASGLPLPCHLLVHGWIKVNQQKMSKSLGNVIDPMELLATYDVDTIRYYLMRYMAITHDSDFSTQDLERVIATDLANELGNLLNRVVGLAEKNDLMQIHVSENWPENCMQLRQECIHMIEQVIAYMDACMFHMALTTVWKYINRLNAFVHETQPWKVAKTDRELFAHYLSAICHGLRAVGTVLLPVMPTKMQELLQGLGSNIPEFIYQKNYVALCMHDAWNQTFNLTSKGPLFMKIEQEAPTIETPNKPITPSITIDDFNKIELVVGRIVTCQKVAKSDRLLQLSVDFGERGTRQVLSGIQAYYTPEQLINRKVAFVFNLAPRMMMGLESQGMILTAQREDGSVSLVEIDQQVLPGTRLK